MSHKHPLVRVSSLSFPLAVAAALLLGTAPGMAQLSTQVTTLTGQVLISAVVTGLPIVNTPATAPLATMILEFNTRVKGASQDDVLGNLVPFSIISSVPVSISGTSMWNMSYTDTCVDTQSISSNTTRGGIFDRASGNLEYLSLTITVTHSLASGTVGGIASGPLAILTCPSVRLPDDVISVSLSTNVTGGSPLDQAGPGQITLVGSGPVSRVPPAGTNVRIPIAMVTIAGVLSPLPDRTLPPPTCVLIPDVTDGVPANAAKVMVAAGFKVVFMQRPGPPAPNLYVYRQSPAPGSCVASGSTVTLLLQQGPVH